MPITPRSAGRLRQALGAPGVSFLEYALGAVDRLLPHTESVKWNTTSTEGEARVTRPSHGRHLTLTVGIEAEGKKFAIGGIVRRRTVPRGFGTIESTISLRERDLCWAIVRRIAAISLSGSSRSARSLDAIRDAFDEHVVADYLENSYGLKLDPSTLFSELRRLAAQTYENKSLAFGCLVHTNKKTRPADGVVFPAAFLRSKKYRALSDGYYSVYEISTYGALLRFSAVRDTNGTCSGKAFHPDWVADTASKCVGSTLGVVLTRHGDLLVLCNGNLEFSCRRGNWQYWNHSHLTVLLSTACRVQKVAPGTVSLVSRALYRCALDVSFRRSGGLFVFLRSRRRLGDFVKPYDQIASSVRNAVDAKFDAALPGEFVYTFPRDVLAELAGLDGAIVVSNTGKLLAYGAVLVPKRGGGKRARQSEGSRTKAAIGASNYGVALKVSSDGDITAYWNKNVLFVV